MRLGFLTTSYPRYAGDPAGSFVAAMASCFASLGDSVEVLAPEPARGEARVPGVEVRPIRYARRPRLCYGAGAPDNLRRPEVWLQVPGFALALARECHRRSTGWDALVSHWLLPCGLLGALAGRGLAHLAVAHSSDVHLIRRAPTLGAVLLEALAARRSALVLTSDALRASLLRAAIGSRARRLVAAAPVVRMGIPDELLAAPSPELRARARRELGVEHDQPVLLFLGRLVPVKGGPVLLEACAGLRRSAPVVVAGDGPERPALQRRARQLGVAARFVGEQTGEARSALLAAADLLVLPSRVLPDGRTESAPLVLLEAMAAGLPVIATRVGGNAELIIDGENGLLVEPDAPAPLRAGIVRLLDDAGLRARLAAAGRRTAAAHAWSSVGPRLRDLLFKVR